MKKIMKKVMGKPMKAQKGKKAPMYDDDANDRLMGETYAKYMNDKKAGKIPLDPSIQKGIKDGTLNPDGTIKKPTQRGSESNTSRTPMKNGGKMKKAQSGYSMSNKFKIPSKNKISIPKKTMKMGGVVKKAQLGMKSVTAGYDNNKGVTRADFVSIGKGEAKKGASMKKCKYGCK